MNNQTPILFLAGASGEPSFWQAVAEQLPPNQPYILQHYPQFANAPAIAQVYDFTSLSAWVIEQITKPTVIVAQSMGGLIGVQAALQKPQLIKGLVLTATSGGMDLSDFQAQDWRSDYLLQNSQLPSWFVDTKLVLTPDLGKLTLPVLLLWGSDDAISPPAVGQFLSKKLPDATLHIITGGKHDFALTHARCVAKHINRYYAAKNSRLSLAPTPICL